MGLLQFSRRFEQPLHDLFNELAQILVGGGEILARTLGLPQRDRARSLAQVHEHTARAADLTHRVSNRLADSLITPFEADALHDLALSMSDALDAMERTAQLAAAPGSGTLPGPLLEAAQVIERACEITVEALWKLQNVRELEDYAVQMRRLRRHGERLALRATLDLYEQGGSAADLLRTRDLITSIEQILARLDQTGRLADLLRVKAP